MDAADGGMSQDYFGTDITTNRNHRPVLHVYHGRSDAFGFAIHGLLLCKVSTTWQL